MPSYLSEACPHVRSSGLRAQCCRCRSARATPSKLGCGGPRPHGRLAYISSRKTTPVRRMRSRLVCRPPLILAPDLLHGRAGKRLLSPEEQVKLVRSLRMTLGGGGGGHPTLSWWCVHQPMRNLRLVSPDRRRSLGARQRGPPASQANTTALVNAQVHEPPVSHGPRADRPRCAARSRKHGTDVLLHFSPGAC